MVGLGRHLTMLVSDDKDFHRSIREDSRQYDRGSVVGDAPPLLLFSDAPPSTSSDGSTSTQALGDDTAVVASSSSAPEQQLVETVVFGISLIVPTFNVHANASMLVRQRAF